MVDCSTSATFVKDNDGCITCKPLECPYWESLAFEGEKEGISKADHIRYRRGTGERRAMGGAASLSLEERAAITRHMAAQYNTYISQGLPDEELQAMLTKDYLEVVERQHNSAPTESVEESTPKASGGERTGKKRRNTRRRSYDNLKMITTGARIANSTKSSTHVRKKQVGLSDHKGESASLVSAQAKSIEEEDPKQPKQSASIPTCLPTNNLRENTLGLLWDNDLLVDWEIEHEEQDQWDSVTQQPRCSICRLTFRLPELLDRHMYSQLHKDNTNKHALLIEQQQFHEAEALRQKQHPTDLLYSGIKAFWRTRTYVALDLVYHIAGRVIEVIGVDTQTGIELNRLYLLYDKVLHLLSHESTSQAPMPTPAVSLKNSPVKSLAASATAVGNVEPPAGTENEQDEREQEEEEEARRRGTTRHVVQRLQLRLADPLAAEASYLLDYQRLALDQQDPDLCPLVGIDTLPKWLVVPVDSADHHAVQEKREKERAQEAATGATDPILQTINSIPDITVVDLSTQIEALNAHLEQHAATRQVQSS